MEVVSAIVGPVVNVLTVHITQKLRYLASYAEHVERMKNRMQFLEGRSADIERLKSQHPNMPAHVPVWLEEVKKIKEDVDSIPSNNIGCFSVKKKFLAGRNAFNATKVIEDLIGDGSKMISDDTLWREAEGCLGRVNSQIPASTSTPGVSVFNSRVKAFNDALKLLKEDDDHKARVIALCGMGGVGKTTLKKQLKEVAIKEKMFNWIADVDIGNTPNLLAIQKKIAVQIDDRRTETDLMATYLSKRFEVLSERKQKTLVILDDVWKESKIKLEDIGLANPLPNGVKLLLTSRDENICQQIAVDADSVLKIVKVDVLEEGEARDFFSQIAGVSEEHDHDLYQIGREIVKKCGCLPLAIKLIAATLKCQKKFVWRRTLKRLKKNDLDTNVQKIIKISYDSLLHDDKVIFLLCGMFPEDYNIPIEDLTRYAWGLKLLERVSTMEDARDSTQTSVSNLKNTYLLMDGDSRHCECVKVHDLVLAFVVGTVSKGDEDGCWIIHHDDFSKWSEADIKSQSCKQISLACKGMSEFPIDFKFPNLTFLKLLQGDESLRFPQDFYVGMEKLRVIAFEKLEYPLVPTSVQFSANLRTLCLHECSLMFDLNCIGNLLNLEVLSFANSGITILPSTFENLKKLRLLDVTGCYNLVIDDGVLKSLEKLEELYMRSFEGRALCFTDNNSSELAERSENLRALEFEFIGDNAHMKNMSYEKLRRFKLSVGCYITEVRDELGTNQVDMHSYENILKLVTNREELLKSKINELFKITHALYLQVNDMNSLEDVRRNSSFYNLRILVVSVCAKLKYLFTPSVATNLSNLEYLEISGCPLMEAVIHSENEDIITFSNLKYLRLADLPKLSSFSNKVNVIKLPRLMELQLDGLQSFTSIYPDSNISPTQSFLNAQDAAPKLEKLFVSDMEKLKKIWPPQFSISNLCPLSELTVEGCGSIEVLFNMDFGEIEQLSSNLRSIEVKRCDSLVKLFSCNPFPFLNNLQELKVERCDSFEVIFDIDMGFVSEMDKVSSSRLRSVELKRLGKLREVWRIKDAGNNLIHGFEAVESIRIEDCERFEKLITPATTTFDMRALKSVTIENCGRESERNNELVESKQDQEIDVVSISKVALPSYLLHTFHRLHKLALEHYKAVEVVFEITTPSSRESPHNTQQPLILPFLEELDLKYMERMSHVWKCDWNEFLILQKPESQSSFYNLTTITMYECHSIKYLFSPLMAKLLSSLKKVDIWFCDAIEEVVSNRDDEDASIYSHTTTTFFPHLDLLSFFNLKKFKCIGGGANGNIHDQLKLSQASWSLCQYAREISIEDCDALSSVVPWYAVGQMQKLQVLRIINCKSMTEVFETQEINNKSDTDIGKSLPRLEYITMLKLPKLKILKIQGCNLLEHIFTLSTLESLAELEELKIKDCESMTEVFETQEINKSGTDTGKSLPRLEYITMLKLPKLKILKIQGCNLLKHIFTLSTLESLAELEELKIKDCESMTEVFETQEINKSGTDTGKSLPTLEYITMLKLPKLKILKLQGCNLLEHIFTFSTLVSLAELEELEIKDCEAMEVIVTEENEEQKTASDVVVFPHLKSLTLVNLPNIVGFFLGKNEFRWPALEKVVIGECPQITVFTSGRSTAPKLNFINTSLGKHSVECGLNFRVTTTSHQARLPSYESTSSYRPTTMEWLPWSYHNLIEANIRQVVGHTLFSSDKLLQLQKLETVHCIYCRDIEQIFDSQTVAEIPNLRQVDLKGLSSLKYIWKSKQGTVLKFPNLTRLSIDDCESLEYVFTCPMVGSLLQLQELHINGCYESMKVIVKGEEEECDAIVNATVVFPCLKSLKLFLLPSLEGFCLGKEAFEFPSLDTLEINYCPEMTVFTKGDLSAPKLYAISIYGRKYNIHNRLNSVVKNFTKG